MSFKSIKQIHSIYGLQTASLFLPPLHQHHPPHLDVQLVVDGQGGMFQGFNDGGIGV